MSQENSNQPQDNNKVQKSFESNLKKLVAILGDESKLRPQTKIANTQLAEITASIFAEDTEKLVAEVKTGIRSLITTKVAFDKALREKEQELQKLKIEKQKEFNQAAQQLFQKIDNIAQVESDYAATLGQISGQAEVEPGEEEQE